MDPRTCKNLVQGIGLRVRCGCWDFGGCWHWPHIDNEAQGMWTGQGHRLLLCVLLFCEGGVGRVTLRSACLVSLMGWLLFEFRLCNYSRQWHMFLCSTWVLPVYFGSSGANKYSVWPKFTFLWPECFSAGVPASRYIPTAKDQ